MTTASETTNVPHKIIALTVSHQCHCGFEEFPVILGKGHAVLVNALQPPMVVVDSVSFFVARTISRDLEFPGVEFHVVRE